MTSDITSDMKFDKTSDMASYRTYNMTSDMKSDNISDIISVLTLV